MKRDKGDQEKEGNGGKDGQPEPPGRPVRMGAGEVHAKCDEQGEAQPVQAEEYGSYGKFFETQGAEPGSPKEEERQTEDDRDAL